MRLLKPGDPEPDWRECQFCNAFHRDDAINPYYDPPMRGLNVNECWLYPRQRRETNPYLTRPVIKKVEPTAPACEFYEPHQFYIDGVKDGICYYTTDPKKQ